MRRLEEVTYADLAERECGYATRSRGLIGPKKRQNAKGNRLFGGWISGSIFGVCGRFFLCPSVCLTLSVRHFGAVLRSFRVFRRYHSWATFCQILRPPRPAERSLAQLVWAFDSHPRDPGSIPAGDTFTYDFNFFRFVGWRQMVDQSSGRLLAGRLIDSNLYSRSARSK